MANFIGSPLLAYCNCHKLKEHLFVDKANESLNLRSRITRCVPKNVTPTNFSESVISVRTDSCGCELSVNEDPAIELQIHCGSVNKVEQFNYDLGFVTQPSKQNIAFNSTPINMKDHKAYLALVSDVLASGLPNYHSVRVPLPSVFNWSYLQQHIGSYHDGKLLDYLKFGFPLNIASREQITNNAQDNHASANEYGEEIDAFFKTELEEGALFGPFEEEPHPVFTWAPLMTRPKGTGRRVILDLTYGDHSVNNHTDRTCYDGMSFKLTLPTLDALIPTLQSLGSEARVFKIDVARAFRHVPIDPGDAIHLGMKWRNKYYIDKFLAFGAVHGTAIFQRITDFIRFILAKQGIHVFNYIDDIYACCHVDTAEHAFQSLISVITEVGLPMNPQKVFSPTTSLTIMGIVVDVHRASFSIDKAKLDEIRAICVQTFLRDVVSKREFQSLLGKLLYISRCVKSRIFLNRLLITLRNQTDKARVTLDHGTYESLAWFLTFMHSFNGVVYFKKPPIQHHIYVDASLKYLGGTWGSRVYSTVVPVETIGERSITQYELYNVLLAIHLWASDLANKTVCVHCDNQSAVTVINSGKTKDTFLDMCIRQLAMLCALHNIDLRLQHARGVDNAIADSLSRGKYNNLGEVQWDIVLIICLLFFRYPQCLGQVVLSSHGNSSERTSSTYQSSVHQAV